MVGIKMCAHPSSFSAIKKLPPMQDHGTLKLRGCDLLLTRVSEAACLAKFKCCSLCVFKTTVTDQFFGSSIFGTALPRLCHGTAMRAIESTYNSDQNFRCLKTFLFNFPGFFCQSQVKSYRKRKQHCCHIGFLQP